MLEQIRSKYFFLWLMVFVIVLVFSFLNLYALYKQTPIISVGKIFLGSDFKLLDRASAYYARGFNPYNEVNLYVFPPFMHITHAFVSQLGILPPFEKQAELMFILSFFTMAFGFSFSLFHLFNEAEMKKVVWSLVFFTCVILGYPHLFLISRGNIDGPCLFFIFLSLSALKKEKGEIAAGVFYALAILIKVYPLVLVAPLFLLRKNKMLITTAIILLLALSSHFDAYLQYFQFLTFKWRLTVVGRSANCSLASFLVHWFALINPKLLQVNDNSKELYPYLKLANAFYFLLLISTVITDWFRFKKMKNKNAINEIYHYIPFMIVYPGMVYNYALVWLIPLIPFWFYEQEEHKRIACLALVVITLSQLNVELITNILRTYLGELIISGSPLFLIILSLVLKLKQLYQPKNVVF